jgi:NAD(P)-dependent dehydrogenase (short-subunit alcohol dehydrogenase family)
MPTGVRFFEANVLSGVRLAAALSARHERANWGRIIFISSESAIQIPAEMIHYGMTKAAQIAVARGLAESLAGTGITVNSVLPGPTKSRGVGDFVAKLRPKPRASPSRNSRHEFFSRKWRPTSLFKRFIAPEEVASLVAYRREPARLWPPPAARWVSTTER